MDEATRWSQIDCFYFWIVTFTTVGFGDVHFSLEEEIEHVYEMLLYRICGLAFLAGLIESIQGYIRYRNRKIAKKFSRRSVAFKHRLGQTRRSFRSDSGGRGKDGGRGGTQISYHWEENITMIDSSGWEKRKTENQFPSFCVFVTLSLFFKIVKAF